MCGADIQLLRWIVHGGAFSMEECRRHCISSPPQSERHRRRGDDFGVTLGRNSAATFPPIILHLAAPNVERVFHSATFCATPRVIPDLGARRNTHMGVVL